MKGFVNINKPYGMTSSDVVVKVRGILRRVSGEKQKVGHLGTLDPIGTGVLPIAVGTATRLFDYMQQKVKVYRATFVFGETTDTLDCTGKVVENSSVIPTREQIDEAAKNIVGDVEQIPPQYSAKSIGGVRAYDLARKGIQVELKPKKVTVYYVKTVDCDIDGAPYALKENEYAFEIACSSGTYIRSIARDLAAFLGTVAYMSSICRIKSGVFEICDSVSLEDFEKMPLEYLKPIDYALKSFEKVQIDEAQKSKVLNGVSIKIDNLPLGDFVVERDGEVLGMGECVNGLLHMKTRL